ncbi:TetR/AcrR family transcriptional regulator [Bacillus daqingensis]|uniref:TetR/AcrR family transcriptional regulator n=1 Tax=Bacillus daqingensis TaxID=872396 RepID=A0ABV9NT52_9BACI
MTDIRIKRTKQALKQALLELLQYKAPAHIQVTELVNRAGLNRSTFYQHYGTIEALLDELKQDVIEDLISAYRQPPLLTTDVMHHAFYSVAVRMIEHVEKQQDFYEIMRDCGDLPRFRNKMILLLKRVLLEEESAAEESGVAESFAAYHAHAVAGLIADWMDGGCQKDASEMARELKMLLRYHPGSGARFREL